MTDWRELKLGSVLELKRGYDLPATRREPGSVPVVSSSGRSGLHSTAKVSGPGVVTGRYGTLGDVYFIREDFWPLNTALYVRDFKGNNPRFVAALLKSLELGRNDAAAAVPGLNRNHLHELTVRVPPRGAQDRIGALLLAFDDLFECTRRRIEVLEQMAQTVYREWFVSLRYPGREGHELVDSPLGPIPSDWGVETLGSVSSHLSRGLAPRYSDDGETLILNQKCIRAGRVELGKARRQSKPIPPEKQIRFGDVLVNSTGVGTLGRVGQVYFERDSLTADTHVTIIRAGPRLDLDYFGLALLDMADVFAGMGVGSTGQTELGRLRLAEHPVLVPSEAAQRLFGEAVSPMRHLAILLGQVGGSLEALRSLLLPKLVTGEIDVSTLDLDELVGEPTG